MFLQACRLLRRDFCLCVAQGTFEISIYIRLLGKWACFKVCLAIAAKKLFHSLFFPCALYTSALHCIEATELCFNFLGEGDLIYTQLVFSCQFSDSAGYVGFANLPNQVHRKSVKKGFEFTLMVVGK